MKPEPPRCEECTYCDCFTWSNRLMAYECKHPSADDGSPRSINLIERPIDPFSNGERPSIKSSPRWCPMRIKNGGNGRE